MSEYTDDDWGDWDEFDDEDVWDYEDCWMPRPTYDFQAKYENALDSLDRCFLGLITKSPIWWIPMGGWDQNWRIDEKIETQDFYHSGNYPFRTDIVSKDVRIVRPTELGAVRILTPIPEDSHRIISYRICWNRAEYGGPRYTAVLATSPPPWGWWMPSLTPNVVLTGGEQG